jgi:uncharacterized protein YdcH (DUF465 family)
MHSSLQQDKRFDHLYQHNAMFRQLSEEHKTLEMEAAKLAKAIYLAPDLEMRELELKKRKLDVKSRLAAMLDDQNP